MRLRSLPVIFFATVIPALAALADEAAERDWREIAASETGPPRGAGLATRDAARNAALAHLTRQEKMLRAFLAKHPADVHALDATLRLSHLLATRGDLEPDARAQAESAALLDALARNPATSAARLADVEFAKLSLFFLRTDPATAAAKSTRETVLARARSFVDGHPQDRRNAALLAEVSTLFDADPPQKKALLEEARAHLGAGAGDVELAARIDDDLRRIAMLGHPVAMRWTSTRGEEIALEKLRGKIVVILFFAEWSPPAMLELERVRELAARHPARDVQALGISLDENPTALAAALRAHKIDWPVCFDGQGWESPMVRSLGINALPTAWILDRQGNLRALNALGPEAEATVEALLRESRYAP